MKRWMIVAMSMLLGAGLAQAAIVADSLVQELNADDIGAVTNASTWTARTGANATLNDSGAGLTKAAATVDGGQTSTVFTNSLSQGMRQTAILLGATMPALVGTTMSVELWVSPNFSGNPAASHTIFETGGEGRGMSITLGDNGSGANNTLRFGLKDGGGTTYVEFTLDATAMADFTDGNHHQLVATHDNVNNMSLYIDGALVAENTTSGSKDWDGTSNAGIWGTDGSGWILTDTLDADGKGHGSVAVFRHYSDVLSAAEVELNYLTTIGAPLPALPVSTTIGLHDSYTQDDNVAGTGDGVCDGVNNADAYEQYIGAAAGGGQERKGFFNGELPETAGGYALTSSADISNATLRVYYGGDNGTPTGDLSLFYATKSSTNNVVDDMFITPYADTGLDIAQSSASGQYYEFDVTSHIKNAYDNPTNSAASFRFEVDGTITLGAGAAVYKLRGAASVAGQYPELVLITTSTNVVYEAVPFPEPASGPLTGPNLIPNGDFDQVVDIVDDGATHSSGWYNLTGSFGTFDIFDGDYATAENWVYSAEDPNGLTNYLTGILDDQFYIDALVQTNDNFSKGQITFNSVADFRHIMTQTDALSAATIDAGVTYRLAVEAVAGQKSTTDPASGTATVKLTDGGGQIVAFSRTVDTFAADEFANFVEPEYIDISGDLLDDGPVSVVFDMIATNALPGFPVSVPDKDSSYLAKWNVREISLAEVYVYSPYDVNRDGAVNQTDVDLANSYLDGSVDGGDDAATRIAGKIADGLTDAEALEFLNLTVFDVNGDDDFTAADVAAIEANIVPLSITSGVMDGSGDFVVTVDVSSLDAGTTLYLKRSENLVLDPAFSVEVDSGVTAGSELVMTDTNAPAGQAFYQVTD